MKQIKFGTDGWRAIIAEDFTVDNVARVAEAIAVWLNRTYSKPLAVVGYDTRFGGELFANTLSSILAGNGIKVFLSNDFVSTPMLSLGTVRKNASLGVIITASHNPSSYNGIKLKGAYGGPLLPEKVEEVEKLIPEKYSGRLDRLNINQFVESKQIEPIDLEEIYYSHVEENFDLEAIRNSGIKIAFDAMYGAGQKIIRRILPEAALLHCGINPSFNGIAPEPIEKNLKELAGMVGNSDIDLGIAVDGDADRIGVVDNEGNFIDSHHLILLLIHYLSFYKKQTGKVCVAFSTTSRIKKMCAYYGLELKISKIGFKYICSSMIMEDVLLGGEESGGIALKNHIPERDGIWIGLVILEYMAKSGRAIQELIKEVYKITGKFGLERHDLHIQEDHKNRIVENCKNGMYLSFGKYKVLHIDDLDGYKYFFNEDEWIMIRPSGTEPVLRAYAESYSKEEAVEILLAVQKELLSVQGTSNVSTLEEKTLF